MDYHKKYLKYKFKYLNLLNQSWGYSEKDFRDMLENSDVYLKDKDNLLTDSISLDHIHKDNAVLIDTQVHDANILFKYILSHYSKKFKCPKIL
jgi:hypothetical protein